MNSKETAVSVVAPGIFNDELLFAQRMHVVCMHVVLCESSTAGSWSEKNNSGPPGLVPLTEVLK